MHSPPAAEACNLGPAQYGPHWSRKTGMCANLTLNKAYNMFEQCLTGQEKRCNVEHGSGLAFARGLEQQRHHSTFRVNCRKGPQRSQPWRQTPFNYVNDGTPAENHCPQSQLQLSQINYHNQTAVNCGDYRHPPNLD